MADKLLKSIKFPTLPDRYVIGDSTLTEEGAAADAKAVGDALAKKADTKGTYEDLIVGGAEQLMSDEYETDKEPYLFRTTGGSADVGNREYLDKIVGGTVAWNQLLEPLASNTANGITETFDSQSGVITLSGTATSTWVSLKNIDPIPIGHVVICITNIIANPNSLGGKVDIFNGVFGPVSGAASNPTCIGRILQNSRTSYTVGINGFSSDDVTDGMKLYANVIDLTQMFGSTIADYIYSLEQSQAGAGVAWFRKLFPKPYYAYNAGELLSVSGLQSHDMTGFNQMNPESYIIGTGSHYNVDAGNTLSSGGGSSRATTSGINPITVSVNTGWAGVTYISEPLVKGSTYKLACSFTASTAGNIRATAYIIDGNNTVVKGLGNYSNASTIPTMTYTPTEAGLHFAIFIGSTSTQNVTVTNLCCHLVWDGSRNGEYEPYQKHTYPLDSSLTLRGTPKLADGKLAFDGDVYPPSGEVQRRYGLVDLGTLTWMVRADVGAGVFSGILDNYKPAVVGTTIPTSICSKYPFHQFVGAAVGAMVNDKTYSLYYTGGYIYVYDTSYTDIASFKAAMSGVYLVYELATPTTETADGYEQYQICDPSGTEEFVTTGIVPVGHETRYPHDLKKKIETAPDSPSTDGTYLMKRSGGKNTYMALPSTPSANGAYVLTVTVSGGTASYSWTAKE